MLANEEGGLLAFFRWLDATTIGFPCRERKSGPSHLSDIGYVVQGKLQSVTGTCQPPGVSFLWKTHKDYVETPPTRPLCDASNGPTARTSDLLSRILTPLMDMRESQVECDSTEDMLHSVNKANQQLEQKPPEEGDLSIFSPGISFRLLFL